MAEKKKTEKEALPEIKNPWLKSSLNLTEQARILREDPKMAARMKAQAAAAAEREAEQARQNGAGQGSAKLPEKVVTLTGRKSRRPRRCMP